MQVLRREVNGRLCRAILAIQKFPRGVDLSRGPSTIRTIKRSLRERPAQHRRRRRNRPGNAQANGPQGDETLESSRAARQGLTDGVSCVPVMLRMDAGAAKSLRFRD